MMNIPAVLEYLRPGEEWTLNGNDYAGLTWLDTTPKPTADELTAAWPAVQAQQAAAAAAEATANTNKATLTQQGLAAMATNRDAIARNAANVAAANPTTLPPVVAALKDALRQLSALEQQNNALIRLVLNQLDGTN